MGGGSIATAGELHTVSRATEGSFSSACEVLEAAHRWAGAALLVVEVLVKVDVKVPQAVDHAAP
jgi:hypothetical protein